MILSLGMNDFRLGILNISLDKKMASSFDLLNACAPIVTYSPWFGTEKYYSMESFKSPS